MKVTIVLSDRPNSRDQLMSFHRLSPAVLKLGGTTEQMDRWEVKWGDLSYLSHSDVL